jgi:hypothetical protein
MKHVLVFLAVYTASLALMVVIVAVALFAWVSASHATGIAFTSSSFPVLLLILLGVFSSWLTRRLLRPRAPRPLDNESPRVS